MSTSRTITSARITHPGSWDTAARSAVWVTLADGTEERLFHFYPDEVSFAADEFVGLTEDEGRALFGQRDREYLRS